MKSLCLIRHAKSSWNDEYVEDFERLLNHRGLQDAPEMGARLMSQGFKPERIISSPAFRALATARRIARELTFDSDEIITDMRIYDAPVGNLLALIREIPDDINQIALIGHNPGIHKLSQFLTSTAPVEYPTCAVYWMQFGFNRWREISPLSGELIYYDYPKNKE